MSEIRAMTGLRAFVQYSDYDRVDLGLCPVLGPMPDGENSC